MKWDVREKIDRETLRKDPRYDPTVPPPPPAPQHPTKRPTGEFIRTHLGTLTLKDILYLGGLAITAVTWAQTRASREDVESARRGCAESAASAIASAFAPVPPRLKSIEKKQARNETRWDRLDAWHTKAFASPFKTPPPKFGPTAEKHGEARFDDEEEE